MSNVVRLEYAYGVCPKCKRVHYLRYLIHNDGLIHKPYEIKCVNCNSYFAKEDIFGSREETVQKPITNADRIRAMTDEELADFFVRTMTCTACADMHGGKCPKSHEEEKCGDMILDWLKQEVEA